MFCLSDHVDYLVRNCTRYSIVVYACLLLADCIAERYGERPATMRPGKAINRHVFVCSAHLASCRGEGAQVAAYWYVLSL